MEADGKDPAGTLELPLRNSTPQPGGGGVVRQVRAGKGPDKERFHQHGGGWWGQPPVMGKDRPRQHCCLPG